MKKMIGNKGITLIALIMTIVVLLILAGVSIAMLTGQNGILTQANSAKSETSKAEVVERINLALNAVKAKVYEKQVSSSTYNPIASSTAPESSIITVLTNDGISTTTPANGVYAYSLADGVLTISYYNTTTNVGTAGEPVEGSIVLDLTDPNALKITPAV